MNRRILNDLKAESTHPSGVLRRWAGRRASPVHLGVTLFLAVPAAGVGASPHGADVGPDSGPAPLKMALSSDTISPADTVALDPVEVTVLRTVTPLSAAPMAVSVLGEEDMRTGRSGTFLEEVLQGLPGVQVQNRFNPAVGERVAIRGFGARAQFGVRGVRVVVDGIPATLPDGQSTLEHIDLGSIGRVEALRGPASSLFGNASGGVLAFHTALPSTAPVEVEAEAVIGSHGHYKGQTTATGTMGETGYLLSLSRTGWDGFRERPNEEGSTYGSADRSGLNARVLRPLGEGELSLTLNLLDLDAENPGSLPADMRSDPNRPAWNFNIVQGASKQVRQGQMGARWQRVDTGSLDWDLSLFAVRREVVNPIPSDIIDLDRGGAGLRMQVGREEATAWGPLRWYSGVEAELQQDDRLNFDNSQGERGALTLDQAERVRSLGLFLQGMLPLPTRGELMVGLRHDRHDFRARDRFPREGEDPAATGDRGMNAVSPSVGIHLPLTPQLDAFASVGTFFETPSTTELANRPDGAGGFNPELEPQEGSSGELGVRGRFGGGFSAWEVTAYRTNIRNELVPFEVADAPGRTYFRNAGSSRHQGVEGTVSLRLPDRPIRADLSYTWTDARFRSFELDGEDLADNRIPGLAPHRARASLRVSPGTTFGELSATYAHRVPVDDTNSQFAPSHTLLDLRTGLQGAEIGNVRLSPWVAVTNLLDREYMASVAVNAFGGRFYEPGPGRSFQLGLRAGF
jgi:iron complex outermembrane recepter protein